MTVPLAPRERTRLVKLLAMLSSNHSGERDAAGLAAHRLVMNAGMTWQDVLTPQIEHHRRKPEPEPERDEPEPDWPPPRPTNAYTSWRRTVTACLNYPDLLTQWELHYLRDIWHRRGLTRRQQEVLGGIAERVLVQPARRPGGGGWA
jgi:hypothetical protein